MSAAAATSPMQKNHMIAVHGYCTSESVIFTSTSSVVCVLVCDIAIQRTLLQIPLYLVCGRFMLCSPHRHHSYTLSHKRGRLFMGYQCYIGILFCLAGLHSLHKREKFTNPLNAFAASNPYLIVYKL